MTAERWTTTARAVSVEELLAGVQALGPRLDSALAGLDRLAVGAGELRQALALEVSRQPPPLEEPPVELEKPPATYEGVPVRRLPPGPAWRRQIIHVDTTAGGVVS